MTAVAESPVLKIEWDALSPTLEMPWVQPVLFGPQPKTIDDSLDQRFKNFYGNTTWRMTHDPVTHSPIYEKHEPSHEVSLMLQNDLAWRSVFKAGAVAVGKSFKEGFNALAEEVKTWRSAIAGRVEDGINEMRIRQIRSAMGAVMLHQSGVGRSAEEARHKVQGFQYPRLG